MRIKPFLKRIFNIIHTKIVKEKITKVSEWFINKYNETNKEFKSLNEIFQYYSIL